MSRGRVVVNFELFVDKSAMIDAVYTEAKKHGATDRALRYAQLHCRRDPSNAQRPFVMELIWG